MAYLNLFCNFILFLQIHILIINSTLSALYYPHNLLKNEPGSLDIMNVDH